MNEVKNNPYIDLGQLAQDNSQLPGNIQGKLLCKLAIGVN